MNLCLFSGLFAIILTGAAPAAACSLQIEADFPVSYLAGHHPVVTVQMNGQPIRMMVDSGSTISYLSARAYDTLDLHATAGANGWQSIGLGGYVNIIAMTMLDLSFGNVALRDKVFPISDQMMPQPKGAPAVDGIMGYDVLENFDIGLDLPHNRMVFYAPETCNPQVTPWTGDFAPVSFTRPDDGSPVITETIDNQLLAVAIDTGAEASVMMQTALARHGVSPEAKAAKAIEGLGVGDRIFGLRAEEFADVTIGAEDISDDWMLVDVTPQTGFDVVSDGLLGEDYFQTHRVFIANSSHTAYLGLAGAN